MGETRLKSTPRMPCSSSRAQKPFTTAARERAAPRPSTTSTAGVAVRRARSQALSSLERAAPS